MDESPHTLCIGCGRPWKAEDFYGTSSECRPCKKERSRQNRLVVARKVALAERLIDALVHLNEQGWTAPSCCCLPAPSAGIGHGRSHS